MKHKSWVLLLSFLALIALVFLASGLRSLQFKPGEPLPNFMPTAIQALVNVSEQTVQTPHWKVLLLWGAFLLNMVLLFFLLSPEARKRVIRQAMRFALTVVALYIALRNYYLELSKQNANRGAGTNTGISLPSIPGVRPGFHPPQMTLWATFLVSLGVLLVFFILLWVGYRWWLRKYGRRSSKALADIATIAQSSIRDIASGRDWGDVIIQSYVRMGEVVSRTRGLQRAIAMTPREFAERLQMTGLPAEAVQRLTRLFESVRYGAHQSSKNEINEAVTCLNSILAACGVPP